MNEAERIAAAQNKREELEKRLNIKMPSIMRSYFIANCFALYQPEELSKLLGGVRYEPYDNGLAWNNEDLDKVEDNTLAGLVLIAFMRKQVQGKIESLNKKHNDIVRGEIENRINKLSVAELTGWAERKNDWPEMNRALDEDGKESTQTLQKGFNWLGGPAGNVELKKWSMKKLNGKSRCCLGWEHSADQHRNAYNEANEEKRTEKLSFDEKPIYGWALMREYMLAGEWGEVFTALPNMSALTALPKLMVEKGVLHAPEGRSLTLLAKEWAAEIVREAEEKNKAFQRERAPRVNPLFKLHHTLSELGQLWGPYKLAGEELLSAQEDAAEIVTTVKPLGIGEESRFLFVPGTRDLEKMPKVTPLAWLYMLSTVCRKEGDFTSMTIKELAEALGWSRDLLKKQPDDIPFAAYAMNALRVCLEENGRRFLPVSVMSVKVPKEYSNKDFIRWAPSPFYHKELLKEGFFYLPFQRLRETKKAGAVSLVLHEAARANHAKPKKGEPATAFESVDALAAWIADPRRMPFLSVDEIGLKTNTYPEAAARALTQGEGARDKNEQKAIERAREKVIDALKDAQEAKCGKLEIRKPEGYKPPEVRLLPDRLTLEADRDAFLKAEERQKKEAERLEKTKTRLEKRA